EGLPGHRGLAVRVRGPKERRRRSGGDEERRGGEHGRCMYHGRVPGARIATKSWPFRKAALTDGRAMGDDGGMGGRPPVEPERDHVRGGASAPTLVLYGDYECPYTRLAYQSVQEVEHRLGGAMRFVYRH